MKNLAYALATVACLTVGPAMAGSATVTGDAPIVLAQSATIILADNGRGRDRGRDESRDGRRDESRDDESRDGRRRDGRRDESRDGRRDFASDRIIVRRGGDCRMVTVTTRTMLSNGRVIIRRAQRCR